MTAEVDEQVLERLKAAIGTDSLIEILDLCASDAPAQLASFKQALGEDDYPSARRAVHTLKSNARNLGAKDFSTLCADLEASARRTDGAALKLGLPVLEARLSAVLAELGAARRRFAK